jgi:hypothetical protein
VAAAPNPAATPDAAPAKAAPGARTTQFAVLAAILLTVLGMMLVIGGVLMTGLFLPGVVLIGIGLLAFAAAAVLEAPGRERLTAAGGTDGGTG